jgi:hypothetical protein
MNAIVIINILVLTEAHVVSDKLEAYLNFLLDKKLHEGSTLVFRWRIV